MIVSTHGRHHFQRGRQRDYVIGFLVLTTISITAAEVTRTAHYFNMLLAAALIAAPVIAGPDTSAIAICFVPGTELIALSIQRTPLRASLWDLVKIHRLRSTRNLAVRR